MPSRQVRQPFAAFNMDSIAAAVALSKCHGKFSPIAVLLVKQCSPVQRLTKRNALPLRDGGHTGR